jgi:hypothetical protein
VSSAEDRLPNPGVYRPSMFICGADPADSVVVFDALPGAEISAALLEEVTDWWQSLRSLPAGVVPDGVLTAVDGLHSAACGWSEWLYHSEKRDNPATSTTGEPR